MRTEVQLEQGSQEWLEFRRGYAMASETPAILDISPYQRRHDIRRVKAGGSGQFVNAAMRKGTELEPVVRALYSERFEPMRPAVFYNGDFAASLDGINVAQDGLFECKVPSTGWASDRGAAALKGDLLPHDYAQVQHQLMVTEAEWCDFCVYDEKERDFKLVRVTPDADYWQRIRAGWEGFWTEVEERTDDEWQMRVDAYLHAKRVAESAGTNLAVAEADLKKLLIGKSNEGCGVRVQRISVSGSTDWKAVQTALLKGVDLTPYKRKDGVQVRINELKKGV